MTGLEALLAITLILVVLGVAEASVHRRRLRAIPIRVHVNGTRGKSSVVRLIAAGIRAGGKRVCAKTTGTLARVILPDGREVPVYRPSGPNIIEQKRIVAVATAHEADALVIECMALQPRLQSLCELELIRSTHGVITNARPDHLDVMGPDAAGVARALAGITPPNGKLFSTEREHRAAFVEAAHDRNAELVDVATLDEMLGVNGAAQALAGFSHVEHADNVAVALAVCRDLGIADALALAGMHAASPDPGAMTERPVEVLGKRIVFVNGFAANDAISTSHIWSLARRRHPMETIIAVFNCRADRPDRSRLLGHAFVAWEPADKVVVMGSGTGFFREAALEAGIDESKLVLVEGATPQQTFERILALAEQPALVIGMGNAGGGGLSLASFFENRGLLGGNS